MAQLPRGVRVFNPGNVVHTRVLWQGEVIPGRDARFATFLDMASGVRASAKILLAYQAHGLRTIADMIHRWAPPVENDTGAYVAAVAAACGVKANAQISLGEGMLARLCKAIFHHENGGDFVSDADLRAGVRMALGLPPAAPSGPDGHDALVTAAS